MSDPYRIRIISRYLPAHRRPWQIFVLLSRKAQPGVHEHFQLCTESVPKSRILALSIPSCLAHLDAPSATTMPYVCPSHDCANLLLQQAGDLNCCAFMTVSLQGVRTCLCLINPERQSHHNSKQILRLSSRDVVVA